MCFYLQFSWLTQLFSLGRMGFLRGWLVCFLFFAELRLQVGLSTACWTLNEELSWFGFQTLFSEPCFLVAQPERETSNQPLWRALWYSVWFNTCLSASYVLSTEKEGEVMWCHGIWLANLNVQHILISTCTEEGSDSFAWSALGTTVREEVDIALGL